MKRLFGKAALALCALTVLCLNGASARADLVIIQKPAGTGNNVLFNGPRGADPGPGNTIVGVTNKGTSVSFTSTVQLTGSSSAGGAGGGQAQINPVPFDNPNFNNLTITLLNGATTDQLIFDIRTSFSGGIVTFSGNGEPITSASTFDLKKNGENFFQVNAINGETIKSFSFTTTVPIDDVRHVRIGSEFEGTPPVPEPATMLLLGTGLAGIAAKLRRRRKTS